MEVIIGQWINGVAQRDIQFKGRGREEEVDVRPIRSCGQKNIKEREGVK